MLRREGLSSSHITAWRRVGETGSTAGLPGLRPPTKGSATPLDRDRLRRRNERLERGPAKNQAALTIMGKAHELLELLSESSATDKPPTR